MSSVGATLLGPASVRDPRSFRGELRSYPIESAHLAGNPAGDPAERELLVYLPPGASDPQARFPMLFCLVGFTGHPKSLVETRPWREGAVLSYDRALAAGELAPAVLVMPDCFTRFGGSQYVDSSYLGSYASHLVEELVPLAEAELPVLPGRRGVLGKSSGGFGALHLAMRHPGVFAAAASISGDCGFDAMFPGEFHACLRGLVRYGMDPGAFLAEFERTHSMSGDGHAVINTLAMAACYSPRPDLALGFELPFSLETGELELAIWERWLAFDPLRACSQHAAALAALELLHLECGLADEFHLQWGLRRLVQRLSELGVAFQHEEHAGGHMQLDNRYPAVFDRMARALG